MTQSPERKIEWRKENVERTHAQQRVWYEVNAERAKAKNRVNRAKRPGHLIVEVKRKALRKDILAQIKLERGCTDCGYRDYSEALEFDHLPGTEKLFAISSAHGRSMEALMAEVAKCEVVCANCHRVRTFLRRNSGR